MTARWEDALTAARLFACDPSGLNGIVVRAAAGPVRDAWFAYLRQCLPSNAALRRLPSNIGDDGLLGGIDLAATLKSGRPVIRNGLLADADVVVAPMAERMEAGIAARIAHALDRREIALERDGVARRVPACFGLIAFDEGASDEESIPSALSERLAFHIDLDGIALRETRAAARPTSKKIEPQAAVPDKTVEALAATAASFGIASIVAPLLALRAARASAVLAGRSQITQEDALLAARLVLAPRALALPSAPPDAEPQPQEPAPGESDGSERQSQPRELEEVMREAVKAALPAGLLEALGTNAHDRAPSRGRGAGASRASLKRGRPCGTRAGVPKPGARLALVETLSAAAPWQALRKSSKDTPAGLRVRKEDFRIKIFAERREATIVFCVDASGSTAFQRLAEAKGAVELLLGEAYIARTHAALVVFRGKGAELLLPPTRSLTRAKALLRDLPGGGGTPLAKGLDMSLLVALGERRKGRDPLIVVLSDGRANIARDGTANRVLACADAKAAAMLLRMHGLTSTFVDTSPRPREEATGLAAAMGARYVALPYAEASAMRDIVRAA